MRTTVWHRGGGIKARTPHGWRRALLRVLSAVLPVSVAQAGIPEGIFSNGFESVGIAVELRPADGVSGTQRISFGLPLPPGALTDTAAVVLLQGGEELPIHVESLGQWHAALPALLACPGTDADGVGSLRSVLIQAEVDFGSGEARSVRVVLGTPRSQTLADPLPVDQTWQLADSGSYFAADGVMEPRALALIDPAHLRGAGLAPALGAAGTRAYMAATDQAQVDFFYTTINDFGPSGWPATQGLVDYKTDFEPWLYDRPAVYYLGHLRNGNADLLREAHRAAHFYAQNIYTPAQCADVTPNWDCVGFFILKNPDKYSSWKDPKYSYAESLELAWWLTGLPLFRETAIHTMEAVDRGAPILQADTANDQWFSERWWGFALQVNASVYAMTGDADQLAKLQTAIGAFQERQDNHPLANGGCFIYDWDGGVEKGYSPWMSALLQYAFLSTWQHTGDARLPGMMVKLAECVSDSGIWTVSGTGSDLDGRVLPLYGVGHDGTPLDEDPWSGIEHSLDVASLLAIGAGVASEPALRTQLQDDVRALVPSHEWTVDYWTRATPDYPRYRVSPPRKYAWQYHYAHVLPYFVP